MQPEDIAKVLSLGFIDYITKPVDVLSFLETIDEVFGFSP
jgi:DNA-binding response OmpR family regulator